MTPLLTRAAAAACATLLLAGCDASRDTPRTHDRAAAAPAPGFAALSPADLATPPAGELRCAFTATGARAPLLVAAGDVASPAPAQALARWGGRLHRLAAPGGFDAMVRGAVFRSSAGTLRVVATGRATDPGESPSLPARLSRDGAAGAIAGEWTCGP